MRLRLLLTGSVGLALAVVGLRLLSLAIDERESALLDRQRGAVEVIARDAAGLLVLTQDYLLHESPRAARQWVAVHRELSDALADYAEVGKAQRDEVSDLTEVAANLPPLFDSLRQLRGAATDHLEQARRGTLADQLVNETRRISDGAFEVSNRLTERRRQANRTQRQLAAATQGVVLMLTLLLAWLLLRRVLAPLSRLQDGAVRVQGGDLSLRVGYRRSDELGELSQAFDAMTAALQERAAALQASNERLARSEAFQERAGRIAGVGGWEIDLAEMKLTWTAQTRALHDVDEGFEPTMDNALAFYAPEVRAVLRSVIAAAMAEGTPWDLELPLTTARGRSLWVRATGAAEFADGRPVRLVGALQDITARRAADEALREATRAAQAASEAKTAFLANMSHEIRTPMNAVIGLSYLMQQTRLDDEQRELLGKINTAGRTLLEVINDVLDLSKIEAGELEIEQVVFDPRALVDELSAVFQPQATQRGIGLHTELPAALPLRLRGDAVRLRQVLSNLLSNALKFTSQGEVRLTVGVVDAGAGADAGPLRLRFAVQDTGIGMGPLVQERLFTPFMQADASITRRFGGTGLGLSIVKRLVALQGGEITVRSAPGEGSCFEVTLPFDRASAGADEAMPGQRPVEVLVAEDDAVQREAMLALCRRLGWRAEAVGDGKTLVERVRERRREGSPPEALIVDWRLPGIDGLQALAALHGDAVPGREPAVVMVSAERREALARAPDVALADELLDKPVEASALFNAVHVAVARRSGDATRVLLASALEAAGVARLPGVRALVVDDSDINREVAQRILVREGAEVRVARDGAEAVALLRDGADGVDIVLMDVQMPVLDGLAAARRIRGELGLKRLPLVALTAGALLSERQRALDAGMDGFVSKPFEPQALVSLLHRLVERARGTPLALVPRANAHVAAEDADPWPAIDGIDVRDAQRRLEGDLGLFTRLLNLLCDEFADLAQTTAPPHDPVALGALTARLHKLAGSAGLLGAQRLQQAAATAESAARRDAAPDALAPRVAAVALALQDLLAASAGWRQQARQRRRDGERPTSPAGASPVNDAALEQWHAQLRASDLGALAGFEQLAPYLRSRLGIDRFEAVETAVGRLAFDEVLRLVDDDRSVA